MNKAELIAAIAAKTGETKKGAEAAVNAFISTVTDALAKGDKVQLVGFGSFEVRKRAARKGRNPRTKEEIKIPASKAPVFKAGKAFDAGILISSLVCGFLPFLAALFLTSKEPNPTNCTLSPSANASVTTSMKALTVASALFFVSPVLAAIAAIKSDLFI